MQHVEKRVEKVEEEQQEIKEELVENKMKQMLKNAIKHVKHIIGFKTTKKHPVSSDDKAVDTETH